MLSGRNSFDSVLKLSMETQRIEGEDGEERLSDTSQESNPLEIPNHLPDELIREILLRLPVKSLLKFQSVSKSWLSLISSSQFVKAHLKISTHNKDLRHHRIVVSSYYDGQIKDLALQPLLNESTIDSAESYYPASRNSNKVFYVVATCDGLICILNGDNFLLLNPSTGKSKILPGFDSYPTNCGLSYDDCSDDYKLVFISTYDFYCNYKVKVCSVKTGSWRNIRDCHGVIPYATQVNMNGKLHWPEFADLGASERTNIVSLDLATENFGVLEPPHHAVGRLTKLVVSGQFLWAYYYSANSGNLWVMKEYGVTNSWTEVVTISFETNLFSGMRNRLSLFTPIYIFGTGEIILSNGDFLVVYSPKDKAFRPNLSYPHNAQIYVKSLVSPA